MERNSTKQFVVPDIMKQIDRRCRQIIVRQYTFYIFLNVVAAELAFAECAMRTARPRGPNIQHSMCVIRNVCALFINNI